MKKTYNKVEARELPMQTSVICASVVVTNASAESGGTALGRSNGNGSGSDGYNPIFDSDF